MSIVQQNQKKTNSYLFTKAVSQKKFSTEEKEAINQRLRGLGYKDIL